MGRKRPTAIPCHRARCVEWLREQYVEERRSTIEIAEERGCGSTTVSKWLTKHGIEAHPVGAPVSDKRLTDAEWLREQYADQDRDTIEIADKCGCTRATVSYWLNKHGIETQTGGRQVSDERLTDADWLREQYVEQRLMCHEIAEECGCHRSSVGRWLNKHDIETRPGAVGAVVVRYLTSA